MDASSLSSRFSDQPRWVAPIGRIGYAAKGVVFFAVGLLALLLAFGAGGSAEGARGAIELIAEQPFGRIILAIVAIGLLAYSIFRFVQAALDVEERGTDAKGIVTRIGFAVSGFIYLGLMLLAARLALSGGGSSGSGDSQSETAATLLSQPAGQWLVAAVGAVIIGVGLYHAYRVYTANFMDSYRTGEMSLGERTWARRIGRFGLAARGLTFVIIGGFFMQAAIRSDPDEAEGLGGALQTLLEQPFGAVLLGVVAAGFIAYAVYCWSRVAYRSFS